jgi:hypothetical protein
MISERLRYAMRHTSFGTNIEAWLCELTTSPEPLDFYIHVIFFY